MRAITEECFGLSRIYFGDNRTVQSGLFTLIRHGSPVITSASLKQTMVDYGEVLGVRHLSALMTILSRFTLVVLMVMFFPATNSAEERVAASETLKDRIDRLSGDVERLYGEGRYLEAIPIADQVSAMAESLPKGQKALLASALNNQVLLYRSVARYGEALPLAQRALSIFNEVLGPRDRDTITSLNNLAALYRGMGRDDESLRLYLEVLRIRKEVLGPRDPDTATSMGNVAWLYRTMGRYDEALQLSLQAADIIEKARGAWHQDTATSLNTLAWMYLTIRKYDDAFPLFLRALEIREKLLAPNHPDIAVSLNNLASQYQYTDRNDEALRLFQQALTIREERLGLRHPITAGNQYNLARLYMSMGRYVEALTLFQLALSIREERLGPRHPDTAMSLLSMAELYTKMGSNDEALPLYRRALGAVWITDFVDRTKDHGGLSELSVIAEYLAFELAQRSEANSDEAIFYYKVSVNANQRLRAGMRGLDKSLQENFTKSVSSPYKALAKLLVARGRIAEAERVLLLLKESELTEYLRRNGGAQAEATPGLQWTADEEAYSQQQERVARQWSDYQARWHAVEQRVQRDEIRRDSPEVQALDTERGRLETSTQRVLEDAQQQFLASRERENKARLGALEWAKTELSSRLGELNRMDISTRRTVGLALLPGERALTMIVTTELGAWSVQVKVSEEELNGLVARMRDQIGRRGAYEQAAKALYGYLIEPAERALADAGGGPVGQWAILAQGALRNLPFAALLGPDCRAGKAAGAKCMHLVERYGVVMLTADGTGGYAELEKAPQSQWRGAALGAPQANQQFGNVPLPGVTREVCGVVRESASSAPACDQKEGQLEGERYLGDRFSEAQFKRLLGPSLGGQVPRVLHIATHFKADTGLLLLGDGGVLSAAQMADWKPQPRLGQYDLVTLSACDTGLNDAAVESLGGLFRLRGAKAVLATLWPVADVGAAPLMVEFYRRHGEHQKLSKAEALRQAQLSMLKGELDPEAPARSLKHPYFWASYVLMGNWL